MHFPQELTFFRNFIITQAAIKVMSHSVDFVRDMISQQNNSKLAILADENVKVVRKRFKRTATGF